MSASDKALCIAIHDVAPLTWQRCERVVAALDEVARLPLTFLVVPAWHHRSDEEEGGPCIDALNQRRASGCELALHGYTHLDEGRRPNCRATWFWRNIYTRGEAEFAGLSSAQARQRLDWGLEWFARQGWPVEGFVPPAWLLSAGSWRALRRSGLRYTTSYSRFHLLQERCSLFAPSLFYSHHNPVSSAASRLPNHIAAWALRDAPLLRLSLFPGDARYPGTLLHMQRMVEKLLQSRDAMTMGEFARRWSGVVSRGSGLSGMWAHDTPA